MIAQRGDFEAPPSPDPGEVELQHELARVIADPGSVLPRYLGGPAVAAESVATWAARAVLVSLPRLAAARPATDAEQAVARVQALAEPGDPDARMDAYYYGFERTGVGIVDDILSAVATAGKAYHGTDMWAEEDEWTKPSHEARIQAAADVAASRIRAALSGAHTEPKEQR